MPRDDDDSEDRPRRRRRFDDDEDDRPRRRQEGGSKVGLIIGLVVGGVVVLLVAACGGAYLLMKPAMQKVQEAAGRAQDANNLKQLGLAGLNSADATGRGYYAPYAHDPTTGRLHTGSSFRVSLLPYMEQENLYRMYDLTQPWDSARNKAAADTVVKPFRSPHDTAPGTETPYRAFVGGGALFNDDGSPVKLGQIPDGTSNTIYLVTARDQVPWAKPQELPYKAGGPLPTLGHAANTAGFNVLFADGSVRFVKANVPDAVLRGMITKAGGEMADPNW